MDIFPYFAPKSYRQTDETFLKDWWLRPLDCVRDFESIMQKLPLELQQQKWKDFGSQDNPAGLFKPEDLKNKKWAVLKREDNPVGLKGSATLFTIGDLSELFDQTDLEKVCVRDYPYFLSHRIMTSGEIFLKDAKKALSSDIRSVCTLF